MPPQYSSILTYHSKLPAKAAPKKGHPKATVIDVDESDNDGGENEEDELSTYIS